MQRFPFFLAVSGSRRIVVSDGGTVAASTGRSPIRRGRNPEPCATIGHAAIASGRRAARLLRGRPPTRGADPATPAAAVEDAGRPGERVVAGALAIPGAGLDPAGLRGPAVVLLGLVTRDAERACLPVAREAAL